MWFSHKVHNRMLFTNDSHKYWRERKKHITKLSTAEIVFFLDQDHQIISVGNEIAFG